MKMKTLYTLMVLVLLLICGKCVDTRDIKIHITQL